MEYQAIVTKLSKYKECEYIIGSEHGEKCGTPHLQGYVEFKNPIYFSMWKKLNTRISVRMANGTKEENKVYCSKEKVLVDTLVIGESKQGRRTDIHTARDMVLAGNNMREIIMAVNSYQAMRCAEMMMKYHEPKRKIEKGEKIRVLWIYGPTGVGKSHWAEECFPEAYRSTKDAQWWDGYDAHEEIIIDDYRKSFCEFSILLKLLDKYDFQIPFKGGFRRIKAKVIVITTTKSIQDTWGNRTEEDLAQLKRRVSYEIGMGLENCDTAQEVGGNTSVPDFGNPVREILG